MQQKGAGDAWSVQGRSAGAVYFEFMDDKDIAEVLNTRQQIIHKQFESGFQGSDSGREHHLYRSLGVRIGDVPGYHQGRGQRDSTYNLKMETVEMAQKVVDKQMMVAREIAGLLGETTAETK